MQDRRATRVWLRQPAEWRLCRIPHSAFRICYTGRASCRGRGGSVAGLDRFEQFFERIVEGTIMRFFRSPIQPAEIGRKLERAIEDGRVVSVGSTMVPNDYHAEV